MDPVVRLQSYFEWLISHPVAELSQAQRRLRFTVDLVRHCGRELYDNDAMQMAAALTYRTIFGLVPLLMVSMLAFRMFGDMEAAGRHLQSALYAFFNYQVDPSRPEATAFKQSLDERVLDVMRSVSGLSFEAIGAVGALLLIWAALGLLVSLENAANRIYRAPQGRQFPMRVGIYWTVLTLGPVLLLRASATRSGSRGTWMSSRRFECRTVSRTMFVAIWNSELRRCVSSVCTVPAR